MPVPLYCATHSQPGSTAAPTLRGLAEQRPDDDPRMGYGACSMCECGGFVGSGTLCENCGHNYDLHY